MAKLSTLACESAKPAKDRDRFLGDGDGLFLRIRPNGTKTWLVEYEFNARRGRFHWQSQNSAGPDTTVGRRYLESPANGWSFQLFVRAARGEPYRTCGPVTLERAEGRKSMSIYWRLAVHLPNQLFREFCILRGE